MWLDWDITFFYRINQGQQNAFFDRVMPYVTEFDHWRFWLLGAWLICFVLRAKKTRITLALLILLVGLLPLQQFFFQAPLGPVATCNACPRSAFSALPPFLFFPFQSCRQCFRWGFFSILYLPPLGPRIDFHRPAGGVLPRLCGGTFSAGCGRRAAAPRQNKCAGDPHGWTGLEQPHACSPPSPPTPQGECGKACLRSVLHRWSTCLDRATRLTKIARQPGLRPRRPRMGTCPPR